MEIDRHLAREWARKIRHDLINAVIQALESMGGDSLLSGPDSGLRSVWEEICAQVQQEESFFWDTYLDVIADMVEDGVRKLSEAEQLALWCSTDAGMDWLCENQEGVGSDLKPPIYVGDIVEEVKDELLSRAADFENPRVYRYLHKLDNDEAYDEEEEDGNEDGLKKQLIDLMPLNTIVTDLWDWDIRFEDDSFADLEEAAFCADDEIKIYADSLAEDFERYIDEWGIDYNEKGWETPEAFSVWVNGECVTFMMTWRANVRKEFGR